MGGGQEDATSTTPHPGPRDTAAVLADAMTGNDLCHGPATIRTSEGGAR